MLTPEAKLELLEATVRQIIQRWHERIRDSYVTEEDSRTLGIEPEVKCFHDASGHRIKFSREKSREVTYGLAARRRDASLYIEASVNNKSAAFDYEAFVSRLKQHYWRSCHEKPWTDAGFDHYTYGDLLIFDPRMGRSVSLDIRKDKADIIRLLFEINSRCEDALLRRRDLLMDLVENYCLAPLKRIYAETSHS